MTAQSIQRILSPGDLDEVKSLACRLLGEVCWQAGFSYGDELVLEFGERIPYKTPRGIAEQGSWSLGTRGTNWELEADGKVVLTSDADPDVMRQQSKQIEGHKLVDLEVGYPRLDLMLQFDGDLRLRVLPVPEDDEYEEIAYWEIFTSDHYLLSVGPNFTWSYVPSNTPA